MIAKENDRCIITINKDLKLKAQERAKDDGRSLSNYIVYLIKKDLEGK